MCTEHWRVYVKGLREARKAAEADDEETITTIIPSGDRVSASTQRHQAKLGRVRSVTFRFACDKKLRDALIDFADDSRLSNPWAADLYRRARARGKTHPHARPESRG